MQVTDAVECDALFKQVNGISRLHDIQESAANPYSHVITDSKAKIIGYTTGFIIVGHTLCVNEKAFKVLFVRTSAMCKVDEPMPIGYPKGLASQLT
jgi:hypothetical protein